MELMLSVLPLDKIGEQLKVLPMHMLLNKEMEVTDP